MEEDRNDALGSLVTGTGCNNEIMLFMLDHNANKEDEKRSNVFWRWGSTCVPNSSTFSRFNFHSVLLQARYHLERRAESS